MAIYIYIYTYTYIHPKGNCKRDLFHLERLSVLEGTMEIYFKLGDRIRMMGGKYFLTMQQLSMLSISYDMLGHERTMSSKSFELRGEIEEI